MKHGAGDEVEKGMLVSAVSMHSTSNITFPCPIHSYTVGNPDENDNLQQSYTVLLVCYSTNQLSLY